VLSILGFHLASMSGATPGPIFTVEPNLRLSKAALDSWKSLVWPELLRTVTPFRALSAVHISLGNWWADCSLQTIHAPDLPGPVQEDVNGVFFDRFTHEMIHLTEFCDDAYPPAFREGRAEAAKNTIFTAIAQSHTDVEPRSAIQMLDVYHNMRTVAVWGSPSYYDNFDPELNRDMVAAVFEHLAHSTADRFRHYDSLVNSAKPTNTQEYLDILDLSFRRIDGVAPSTFIDTSGALFTQGPDGEFLVLYAYSEVPGWYATKTGQNANRIRFALLQRKNGHIASKVATIRYAIFSADGKAVVTDSISTEAVRRWTEVSIPGIDRLPVGAYQVSACVTISDGHCGSGPLRDYAYFFVYRGRLAAGDVVVINNRRPFGSVQ